MDDRRQIDQDRRQLPRVGGRRATDPPPEWMSISAFARHYGIARGTVYKWLEEGLLETYRVGTITRIRNLPPGDRRDPKEDFPQPTC